MYKLRTTRHNDMNTQATRNLFGHKYMNVVAGVKPLGSSSTHARAGRAGHYQLAGCQVRKP